MANAEEVQSLHTLPHGDGRGGAAPPAGRPASALALGRYRLLERLGAGGFGVVWRAHDERLDREVAVKRIVLAPGAVPDRVTREALATARLAHPAIVALYEAAADEDAFCLVSELVRGCTLARLIARDELTDDDVLAIGLALCDALEHAHERGVIHRDVKPQNVLVPDPPGAHPVAAKLADFGGAWITGEDPLTRTGDVMGTLAYMAPEQAEGGEVGEECDLYSCALVCFEALSGINPVRGATPAGTARRIGTEQPSLHEYRPDLPGELVAAIDVALDPVAHQRGALSDLRDALADAADSRPRRRGWFAARGRRAAAEPGERPSGTIDEAGTAVTRAGAPADGAPSGAPAARHDAIVWPEVAWEGEDPETLVGRRPRAPSATRGPAFAARRSGRPAAGPLGRARSRSGAGAPARRPRGTRAGPRCECPLACSRASGRERSRRAPCTGSAPRPSRSRSPRRC